MAFPIPELACDSHMHVFGPPDRYPGAVGRTYSPSLKPMAEYRSVADRLGLHRTVLVQPSAYGTDNRALLDALGEGDEALRAVVVIDDTYSAEALQDMHRAGVRGVRLNLLTPRITETEAARSILESVAAQVADLGWHVQIYCDGDILRTVAPVLADLSVPVVFDHMGGARLASGPDEPGFRTLCELLARDQCWAKLSGADIVTGNDQDPSSAIPFARALVAANPSRLVWGSDWPHLVHQHGGIGDAAPPAAYRPVNEQTLLDVLTASIDDAASWRAILTDNPARLYDF